MIHVAHGIHDKTGDYSRHLCATIESYLSNTQAKVCVHILHDNTLGNGNKDIMKKIASSHDADIRFYNIQFNKTNDVDYERLAGNVTIGALFRLKLADALVDIDKVIYLDSDIICTLDLQDMWDIDLADYSIAAVADVPAIILGCANREFYQKVPIMNNKYFNSGVVVFNLNRIKKTHDLFRDSIGFLLENKDAEMADQDALNYLFQSDCRLIDRKFNFITSLLSENDTSPNDKLREWDERKCWHFAGREKPWLVKMYPVSKLYWKYLARTPWCDIPEKVVEWMYNLEAPPLADQMLVHRIGSRNKLVKNYVKRLYIDIKQKYFV